MIVVRYTYVLINVMHHDDDYLTTLKTTASAVWEPYLQMCMCVCMCKDVTDDGNLFHICHVFVPLKYPT